MDKLIQSQPMQETIKICYGNDFNLSVSVNVWNADTSAWDKLDLSAASDIEMFLVAQNGKRIKTTSSLDNEGNITASIPSTYLSKTLYALEITFKQDNRNRRTYSPCMIQIVNSTDEAGQSVMDYTTNDSYHFDILVKNDIAWLNIGSLPSEYVTEEELADVLTSYATISSVDNQINALWQDAGNTFIDDSELATALSSYATKSYVDSALEPYATTSYVNSYYYDKTEVDSKDEAVKSYVSSHYYDKTYVDTTFNSYVNAADYDSNTKHINLKNGNTVISYIDAADFVIDGMVDFAYVDNGYLMIIFNTDAGHEDIAIPISDIFDANNYYNRTDVDNLLSSYVTETDLANAAYVTSTDLANASYVTETDLANASYVTETDLTNAAYITSQDLDTTLATASYATVSYVETTYGYLDTRVTYLEQHGGGGGGGTVPSNVVTSYDGTYIYCLTQSEYDDLESNGQLDTYTFYYITDASTDYVDKSYLESYYVDGSYIENNYATISYVETSYNDLDTRVTYLEEHGGGGGGTIPDNVVTSYDGSYIYCLSQSEYDTLEQNQQLDSYTFYYINDATSYYVSSSDVTNIVTMSYSDYGQITPNPNTLYIII